MQLTIVFINTFCIIIVTFKGNIPDSTFQQSWFGWAMRTYDIYDDAHNHNEYEEDVMRGNVWAEMLRQSLMGEDYSRLPQIL